MCLSCGTSFLRLIYKHYFLHQEHFTQMSVHLINVSIKNFEVRQITVMLLARKVFLEIYSSDRTWLMILYRQYILEIKFYNVHTYIHTFFICLLISAYFNNHNKDFACETLISAEKNSLNVQFGERIYDRWRIMPSKGSLKKFSMRNDIFMT